MSLHTDQKFVGLLSPRLDRFAQVRPNLWNSRCPICGDSQKNKAKKRLYIYAKKTNLFVKCHNCGYGSSLGNFIKELDPHLHGQYVLERYSDGSKHKVFGKTEKKPEFKFSPPKFKPKKTVIHLPSIGSLPKEHYARKYYEDRKIPGSFMDLVFYADDFKKWVNSVCQTRYDNLRENDQRLVIPFFDENGKLIAAQGRALGAQIRHDGSVDKKTTSLMRYITVKVHEDDRKIYGLDRWNPEQPTYIVEGPIDSMFIPNCLAVAGGDLGSYKGSKENTTLIFDNEPRNFHTVLKLKNAVKDGWKVLMWDELDAFLRSKKIYKKIKDINDLIINDVSPIELLNFINKNTARGLDAAWRSRYWSNV